MKQRRINNDCSAKLCSGVFIFYDRKVYLGLLLVFLKTYHHGIPAEKSNFVLKETRQKTIIVRKLSSLEKGRAHRLMCKIYF